MYRTLVELMSNELGLDLKYIENIINNANNMYTVFSIPKSNGKKRTIYEAKNELKTLQYWVTRRILLHMPISENTYAYVKGKSIKENAKVHINSKHLFHSDIEGFFPSITDNMLSCILEENKEVLKNNYLWYEDTLGTISKVCFRKGKLCIGAVSSPLISNIVMFKFDKVLNDYCLGRELKYTRYADDLYISSNGYISNDVYAYVYSLLSKYGFSINKKKTKYLSSKNNIRITGINVINQKRLSISTDFKKKVKKMLYKYLKHGEGNPNEILGYLSFLKDIEPSYFNTVVMKYVEYTSSDVITYLRECTKKDN